MTINAWPFLVSRNKVLGYQTIVAPDFLIKARIAGILATKAGGNSSNQINIIQIDNKDVGTFSIAYRITTANKNGNIVRDELGRPIVWIEGLVLRNPKKSVPKITNIEMDKAHSFIVDSYWRFWESVRPTTAESSTPFKIPVRQQKALVPSPDDYNSQKYQKNRENPIHKSKAVSNRRSIWRSIAIIFLFLIFISGLLNYWQFNRISTLEESQINLTETINDLEIDNQNLESENAIIRATLESLNAPQFSTPLPP